MLGTPVVPAAAVLLCWGWCCVGIRLVLALVLALALVFMASTKREAEGGGKEPDDV